MKKILFPLFFLMCLQANAGNPFAGDITFYQDSISPLLIHIEITILTHDNIDSFAGTAWGLQGASTDIPISDTTNTTNGFFFEKYRGSYQYVLDSIDSIVNIVVFMQNRISSISNIGSGNMVNVPFCIKATVNLGILSRDSFIISPVFLASPYVTCIPDSVLTYNPQITDVQGDSVLIQLVTPIADLMDEVPEYVSLANYYQITGPGFTFSMDSATGAIMWNRAPGGLYDMAYQVSKYRHGQFIGSVMRDMLLQINQTTGLKSVSNNEAALQIYPNPTTASLKITPSVNTGSNYNIEISNILGQTVYKAYPNNNQIDVSSLAAGIYLLKLEVNGVSQTAKFVKE